MALTDQTPETFDVAVRAVSPLVTLIGAQPPVLGAVGELADPQIEVRTERYDPSGPILDAPPPPSTPGPNGPGEMLTYPASTRLLAFTPPTGIDTYGNGTVYDTDAVLLAPPSTWRAVATEFGGNLQTALDAVARGEGLILEDSGTATYTGNFTLPQKSGAGYVWLVSRSEYNRMYGVVGPTLPRGPRQRVTAAHAAHLAVVQGPATGGGRVMPVFACAQADAVGQYVFRGLEIRSHPDNVYIATLSDGGSGGAISPALVSLTDDRAGTALAARPDRFIFDRCWIHGHASQGVRRGVLVNASRVALLDCLVSDIHKIGDESAAVGGWSGCQYIKLLNCRLEAGAQFVLFGGADPKASYRAEADAAGGAVNPGPVDIEVRHCYGTKPLTWNHRHATYAGRRWMIKTGYEHKNGSRTLVEGCVWSNCWVDAQVAGTAVLLQNLTDGNTNHRHNRIEDFTLRHCQLDYVASGVQLNARAEYGTKITLTPGSPVTITWAGHPLLTGEEVNLVLNSSANGLTGLPAGQTRHTVTVVDANTFTLNGTSATGTVVADAATPAVTPKVQHPTTRVQRDNLLITRVGLDMTWMGGARRVFEIYNDLSEIRTENVTVGRSDAASFSNTAEVSLIAQLVVFTEPTAPKAGAGMVYRNILMPSSLYGWKQVSGGTGAVAINGYHTVAPTIQGCVLYEDSSGAYPAGFTKLATRADVGFVDPSAENWRLATDAAATVLGAGGGPTGCDHDLLAAYLAGVVD